MLMRKKKVSLLKILYRRLFYRARESDELLRETWRMFLLMGMNRANNWDVSRKLRQDIKAYFQKNDPRFLAETESLFEKSE